MLFNTIINIKSPHEEILSWQIQLICPWSIDFTTLMVWGAALITYVFFSYNNYLLDKAYSKFPFIFSKFLLTTLRGGFKVPAQPFFPLIFILFLWFYMGNAVMSIPFTICITTFLPIVFFGALITFGTANIIGLYQNKLKFLNLFLPPGTPRMISFILVPVEIIAYVARLVSLSVRLFANMLAGYILMEMFFTFLLMSLSSPFVNIIPSFLLFIVLVLLAMLKLLISFLQAYIFSLLVSFYLNDPIHLH